LKFGSEQAKFLILCFCVFGRESAR
jgi:hypothetical protein